MIKSILIANRGEIACRVIRTARAMGIRTVAVYSDADAKSLHVRMADEAVHIGPSPAAESYLIGDRIIAAAKETGAEAIHPGYGFLSENAAFAQAVLDAGLVWVGPKPASINAMGLKDAAKALMAEAGVPVTPGYMGDDQSDERLKSEADAIGYPVLIKAVAGGGGKGMRKVDAEGEFMAALESCRREARASFGNDVVLIEKFILSPRHIEVQVFGDSHGNVVHLFERDCSLQRRHQKVIEEAPAPGMDSETREAICAAAVKAAQAVNYEGAGTIEFIADASEGLRADRTWFMEMNTRLQVEHPVTEEITGVDLVEWQIRVASGEIIPKGQDELSINGHAIEARLYAEDPASGFLPSTGRLDHLSFGLATRIETGVEEGGQVSPFYDPMIAKVVCHAEDRDTAIDDLVASLADTEVWPVRTNAGFLVRALDAEDFRDAKLDTGFIARHGDELVPDGEADDMVWNVAARIAYGDADGDLAGFRLNAPARRNVWLSHRGEGRVLDLAAAEADSTAVGDVTPDFFSTDDTLVTGYAHGDHVVVFADGMGYGFDTVMRGSGHGSAHDGDILAPMPGKVLALDVAEGDEVKEGQRLMVLEAMKMEHALTAPFDGKVADLAAKVGGQVEVEALLARIEPKEE
ncbi:acetyl/propionyl/methylcrotonyl-CoA carboxylase subunit alpha [Croceicoccus gelatinilyticus]|uniref:acetyl/propionyl/methylcrotonyl-CoA carboxylase subunit alpha n=1 Tax=Croceicoccus gelatinilyticus TaxID=2835536 RepID=UPI001BCD0A5E|nr:acetyl/propionyl/methylcrotonyl-CoA carboxylase subunit alpha [Croceicoccus gelatinilyticus]MBS7668959.1 acetyl/propionyl/methylcrotonyl-CoA carboxylase subunit alpha [Croceicoccus gelatinilyticus]